MEATAIEGGLRAGVFRKCHQVIPVMTGIESIFRGSRRNCIHGLHIWTF
jgi:hypothetical protein